MKKVTFKELIEKQGKNNVTCYIVNDDNSVSKERFVVNKRKGSKYESLEMKKDSDFGFFIEEKDYAKTFVCLCGEFDVFYICTTREEANRISDMDTKRAN